MIWLARFLRALAKLRFRLLGLATIQDVPGTKFRELLSSLVAQGWRLKSKYSGFDAGIDYNRLHLRKGFVTLKCEWDNWSEWSIEGPRKVIESIATANFLKVKYAWRWSAYDETSSGA